MIFFINFSEHGKGQEKPSNVKILTWEISSQEKPTKHIVCGELGKLLLIIFPKCGCSSFFFLSVFNWDSFHARLNNQYKEWSYKKN